MLFNRPDTLKVLLPVAASARHVIHAPWTHPTQYAKLHLHWFSYFCTAQAHGRQSLCVC